ncbi:MAG: hypothetical protein MUF52_06940 [Syntrophobacteraceae bacterium]|jgi:hypothetical protein|nr:hypothetical protein [Syntrophobacteraceae bacterium]
MKQLSLFQVEGGVAPRESASNGRFTQYVENQACRMEQCGWVEEATNLRRWARELRAGDVESGYVVQEPLLPRS